MADLRLVWYFRFAPGGSSMKLGLTPIVSAGLHHRPWRLATFLNFISSTRAVAEIALLELLAVIG